MNNIMSLAAEGYKYILRKEGIRGGHAHIQGTRIAVHDVAGLFVNGSSVDEIQRSFPGLNRAQIFESLAYYEDHRDMIDLLISRQMAPAP